MASETSRVFIIRNHDAGRELVLRTITDAVVALDRATDEHSSQLYFEGAVVAAYTSGIPVLNESK